MNATVIHARTGDHALALLVAMHVFVNLDSMAQIARVRFESKSIYFVYLSPRAFGGIATDSFIKLCLIATCFSFRFHSSHE